MHYGVPGQKPGHRRYQNPDGTLTPEGREHYGVGDPREPGQTENTRAQVNKRSEAGKAAYRRKLQEFNSKSALGKAVANVRSAVKRGGPIGLIVSSRRMQKRRQQALAAKRAAQANG